MEPWCAAGIAFLGLLLALLCHRKLFALFPEDQPGQAARKQHPIPTPLVGWTLGLAALGLNFGAWWLMAGLALTTYIGYLDDRGKDPRGKDDRGGREVGWQQKGRYLAAAAICGTVHLWQLGTLSVGEGALVLLILFVVTNAANFLDNTNGVTAALGALGLLWASDGQGPMAWVAFAYLGFLPLNWPRAFLFLGDSGALTMGLCLGIACLAPDLVAREGISLVTLAPMAVFLLDFTQVVIARLVIGVPPWIGDRRHLTHILIHLHLPRWLVAPVLVGVGWLVVEYLPPR